MWWWYREESFEVWPWTLIPRRKNLVDGCRGSHHGSVFIRRLELSPVETVLSGWQVPGPVISPSCREPHPEVQSHGSYTRISLRREKERVNRSHNRTLSSGLDGPSRPHQPRPGGLRRQDSPLPHPSQEQPEAQSSSGLWSRGQVHQENQGSPVPPSSYQDPSHPIHFPIDGHREAQALGRDPIKRVEVDGILELGLREGRACLAHRTYL